MWSKGSPSSMESSSPKQPPEELSVKLLHTTLDNNSSRSWANVLAIVWVNIFVLPRSSGGGCQFPAIPSTKGSPDGRIAPNRSCLRDNV